MKEKNKTYKSGKEFGAFLGLSAGNKKVFEEINVCLGAQEGT